MLSDEARDKMTAARELVDRAPEHTYGVNTGFGRFVSQSISDEQTEELQLRLLRSAMRALREGVDIATATGRAVAAIMATLADLELDLGRERRAASRESRRARQLPATKPAKLAIDRQEQLRRVAATGEPVHELAEAFGISRATAYHYLSTSP